MDRLHASLVYGLALALAACGSVDREWQRVRSTDRTYAYEKFLNEHPESEHVPAARKRLEVLAWKQAEDTDTVEAYRGFLAKYPESAFAAEARQGIASVRKRLAARERKLEEKRKRERNKLMFEVAGNGDVATLKKLLREGADVDARGNGGTALHRAAFRGDIEVAKILVAHGADVNARNEREYTPLHLVGPRTSNPAGQVAIAKLLVAHGADPKARQENGLTPLQYAELCASTGIRNNAVIWFLQSLEELSKIHEAVAKGDADRVARLLDKGADVNSRDPDNNGFTPLHWAAQEGRKDIAKLLLSRGADVAAECVNGTSPVLWATIAGRENVPKADYLAVLRMLLDAGAKANHADANGTTALYIAAQQGHVAFAKLLIERGADVNLAEKEGYRPLHMAALRGRVEMAELLVAKGARTDVKAKNGVTPLDYAKKGGAQEIIELLGSNPGDG